MRSRNGWTVALLTLSCVAAFRCEADVSPSEMPERAAVVVLKVADFGVARDRVSSTVQAAQGVLLDARTDVTDKGRRHGWLRFRVTGESIGPLLADIKQAGILYSEKVATTDTRPQADEMAWRLDRLREHQRRLDGLLNGNRRLRGSDTLYVQERRFRAGIDEGIVLAQLRELRRATGTCALQVQLFEPGATPLVEQGRVHLGRWFAASLGRAGTALNHAVARAATMAAYALVFSPVWLVAALLAYLGWRRYPVRLRFPQRPSPSPG